jgi:hypothetical protein
MSLARAALAAVAALLAASAAAATYTVDDLGTLPNDGTLTLRWRSLAPNRAAGDVVEGSLLVTMRLNVAPWLNRTGQIYMVLPQQPIGQVTVDWTTQGRLLPGKLISGQRTIVYSGPIRTPVLEDTFVVKVQTDGKRLASPQRLDFHFEIDVN